MEPAHARYAARSSTSKPSHRCVSRATVDDNMENRALLIVVAVAVLGITLPAVRVESRRATRVKSLESVLELGSVRAEDTVDLAVELGKPPAKGNKKKGVAKKPNTLKPTSVDKELPSDDWIFHVPHIRPRPVRRVLLRPRCAGKKKKAKAKCLKRRKHVDKFNGSHSHCRDRKGKAFQKCLKRRMSSNRLSKPKKPGKKPSSKPSKPTDKPAPDKPKPKPTTEKKELDDSTLHGAFRKCLVAYIKRYAGAVEGGALFTELFPNIKQTRKQWSGYTTCVDFVGIGLKRCLKEVQTKWPGAIIKPMPSNYFFHLGSPNPKMRQDKKTGKWYRPKNLNPGRKCCAKDMPKEAYMQVAYKGNMIKTEEEAKKRDAKDPTAMWGTVSNPKTRPRFGDIYFLAFHRNEGTIKLPNGKTAIKHYKGSFSHQGFVMDIVHKDGKEVWTTADGGQGQASKQKEAITKTDKVFVPSKDAFANGKKHPNLATAL